MVNINGPMPPGIPGGMSPPGMMPPGGSPPQGLPPVNMPPGNMPPQGMPQPPQVEVTESSPDNTGKPNKKFLDKTQSVLDKRFKESKEIVDAKKPDWDRHRDMYNNIIKSRDHNWESNLIIPKSYYIVQTMTPWILSAIFDSADFLTLKSPRMSERDLIRMGKWFTWFLLRKMHIYMRYIELFTESPITGTSFLKLFSRNGVPTSEFLPIDQFYPDPRSKKPGDIDSMLFCFHKFLREFGQLEQARTLRVRQMQVSDLQTDPQTGIMTPLDRMEERLVDEPLYFNLKDVWTSNVKNSSTTTVTISNATGSGTSTEERQVNLPEIELVEHWGQLETTFGIYDLNSRNYKPGRYEEYVVTSVLDGGDSIDTIIRCEPSTLYYEDKLENARKYVKPFVTSLYSVVPGQFYGKGVIEPIESLITEMKEHHDLYLDEHKRSVMTILSVLERSGLTPKDLPFSPYAHWIVRSHDDVQTVKFPEMNLQAFNMIHGLLDREIDRTSGSSSGMQGVATSKRQTKSEFEGLMMESSRRFSLFIKMSDHLTLRPTAFKTMLLMQYMPAIHNGTSFVLPDEEITIDPESLSEELEFAFAATGVEPEYSKYAKQEMFPRLLKELSNASGASNGKYIPNMPEIAKELDQLYNFTGSERFMEEVRKTIPVDLLKAAANSSLDNPQENQMLDQALQKILKNAEEIQDMDEESKSKSGGKRRR